MRIVKSKELASTENVWGRFNEYSLVGSLNHYAGYEWIWIEYLVGKKGTTTRMPQNMWLFARELENNDDRE